MMGINNEAHIQDQLLICQTSLSPCSRNNVGTKEIPIRTKAIIAILNITNFFIFLEFLLFAATDAEDELGVCRDGCHEKEKLCGNDRFLIHRLLAIFSNEFFCILFCFWIRNSLTTNGIIKSLVFEPIVN